MAHLAFETSGNPDNPAVLMLHGFMSCRAQWMLNAPVLAERYHVINVELWGHGESPVPEDTSAYSIERYAEEFERIRESLGISRWAVIGQSYGAGLICRYALSHPDRCSAVVATNSRSAFGVITPREAKAVGPDRNSPKPLPKPRELPLHPINARRFPEHVKAALVAAADAMSPQVIADTGRLARHLTFSDRLGELTMPFLLTNGVYEKTFQDDVARLKGAFPDLAVADLEGGHSVNIEDANGFNQAVLAFLEAHP